MLRSLRTMPDLGHVLNAIRFVWENYKAQTPFKDKGRISPRVSQSHYSFCIIECWHISEEIGESPKNIYRSLVSFYAITNNFPLQI